MLSSNPNDEIQTQAYNAMAVLEQFETLTANLSAFAQTLDGEPKQEMEVHLQTLQSLIEVIDVDGAINVGAVQVSLPKARSMIERLQIGGELIRRRSQHSIAELATIYGIGEPSIRRFFRLYENAKPKEQLAMQRTSIMDSVSQMENLAVVIQRNMAKLEGQNDEVNVKFVSEMRQLIELASKLAEKMAHFERINRLQEVITEVLIGELPHKRTEILQKMSRIGQQTTSAILKSQLDSV